MKLLKLVLFALTTFFTQAMYAQNFPDWHQMNQQTLDDSYNNSKAVPESKAMFDGWVERSQAFRAAHPEYLDISYGPLEREKIDYFSAGKNTPVVIFIHGGFWQMRSKNDFAFIADHFLKEGISVAMVGYPLAPQANMDEIVSSSKKAVEFIGNHVAQWGGNPNQVILTGWSSGGHLTITSMDSIKMKAAIPISGIYELEPLIGSYLNTNLKMDQAIADKNSPMMHVPPGKTPIYIFVGGAELSEMRRQSHDFAKKIAKTAHPNSFVEIPGKNHYTMLVELEQPTGLIHQKILETFKQ